MLVTVVDETLLVAQAVHQALLPAGIKTAFAGSLQELPLVFGANGLPDLLVINVTGETTDYEAADYESSKCNDCGASWGGASFWE